MSAERLRNALMFYGNKGETVNSPMILSLAEKDRLSAKRGPREGGPGTTQGRLPRRGSGPAAQGKLYVEGFTLP
jgi:hypothetical protein